MVSCHFPARIMAGNQILYLLMLDGGHKLSLLWVHDILVISFTHSMVMNIQDRGSGHGVADVFAKSQQNVVVINMHPEDDENTITS